MNGKRWIVVAGLAVAAGVGIAAMNGLIPPRSGVEGTIAGAKRYQVEQISDKDVGLSDPAVQAFLQSDLFHKISTDPNFGKTILVPAENGKLVRVPTENGKLTLVPTENGKAVLVAVENGKTVRVPTENGKLILVPTENGKYFLVPTEKEMKFTLQTSRPM
jgi:hypothetical protein